MLSNTMEQLSELISKCGIEDLRFITVLCKRQRDVIEMSIANTFHPGQRVEFIGRHSIKMQGMVKSVGVKRVKVVANNGVIWTISASLLKLIQ
jgi:hypothetical protein